MIGTHFLDSPEVDFAKALPPPVPNYSLLSHLPDSSTSGAPETSEVFFDAYPPVKLDRTSPLSGEASSSQVQLALHVIDNADLKTASVLQKACIERIEKLQNETNIGLHNHEEKQKERVHHNLEVNFATGLSEELESASQGSSKVQESSSALPNLPHPNNFHRSNPFHVEAAQVIICTDHIYTGTAADSIQIGPATGSPTLSIPVCNTKNLHKNHLSHRAHQLSDNSKKNARRISQFSQTSFGRSDSIVMQAGDRLRGSFASMKDIVKEKASNVIIASINSFPNPNPNLKKNKASPKVDDEDDLMFFDFPHKSPKKLYLVREESPHGTRTWAVKEQKTRVSDAKEDKHIDQQVVFNEEDGIKEADSDKKETGVKEKDNIRKESSVKKKEGSIKEEGNVKENNTEESDTKKASLLCYKLSLVEVDEDSFLGNENIAQFTTSSGKNSPLKQTMTNFLPSTPISQSMVVPRPSYPPRISSLRNSPALAIPHSNPAPVNGGTFVNNEESRTGGTKEEEVVSTEGFQRISSSNMLQGFRRLASDGQITGAASQSNFEFSLIAPPPPPKDKSARSRVSPAGPTRGNVFSPRLTTLVQKATSSIRRTKTDARRGRKTCRI